MSKNSEILANIEENSQNWKHNKLKNPRKSLENAKQLSLKDRMKLMQAQSNVWSENTGSQNDTSKFKNPNRTRGVSKSVKVQNSTFQNLENSSQIDTQSSANSDTSPNSSIEFCQQISERPKFNSFSTPENAYKNAINRAAKVNTGDGVIFVLENGNVPTSHYETDPKEDPNENPNEKQLEVENPDTENQDHNKIVEKAVQPTSLFDESNDDYQPKERARGRRRGQKNIINRKNVQLQEDTTEFKKSENLPNLKIKGNLDKDISALRGLAVKEDFTDKKSKLTSSSIKRDTKFQQFYHPMMLEIKQTEIDNKPFTRLVPVSSKMMSTDSSLVLITGEKKIYAFFGQNCIPHEISKVREVVRYIVANHNHGTRINKCVNPEVVEIKGKDGEKDIQKFRSILDDFEIDFCDTNSGDFIISETETYKFDPSAGLIPMKEACGKRPIMSLLKDSEIYVFDFLNEVYVWKGLRASTEMVKHVFKLAERLLELKERASWCLFAKISEDMESALFQEKFSDWSNIERRRIKQGVNVGNEIDEMKLKKEKQAEDKFFETGITSFPGAKHDLFKLSKTGDGLNTLDVSFGDGEIRDDDGRILRVRTLETVVTDSGAEIEVGSSELVLNLESRLIIHWKFLVQATGRFEGTGKTVTASDILKKFGESSDKNTDSVDNGQEHEIVMAWFGENVPAPEQLKLKHATGKSGIRHLQHGCEPVVFFRLLNPVQVFTENTGDFVDLHDMIKIRQKNVGNRKLDDSSGPMSSNTSKLRLVNPTSKTEHFNNPETTFWSIEGLGKKFHAFPLSKFDNKFTRAEQYHSCFRDKAQTVLLIDASKTRWNTVFIVLGSTNIPSKMKDFSKISGENLQRQTSAEHCKFLYYGNESDEFKSELFLVWVERESLHLVPDENLLKTGIYHVKSVGSVNGCDKIFSWEELQNRAVLPDDVDKNCLEKYLEDAEFFQMFGMDKEEFYKLAAWRQKGLRKKNNLF